MSNDRPQDASGCLHGCSGCFIVLAVFVVIIGVTNTHVAEIEEKKNAATKTVQEEIKSFGKTKAEPLYKATREIASIKLDVQAKIYELTKVLTILGKQLDKDEDYNESSKLLREIEGKETKMQEDLENAYLLYKKSQILPDKSAEEKIGTIASGSLKTLEEVKAKFKSFKEKHSGGK